MTEQQEDTRKKPRRDLLLILLILPFGVLCMFMTGQTAIRLAPEWSLKADMRSMLDPNATFVAQGIPQFIEPINPAILTRPAWGSLFLTPQAVIPTRVIVTATPPPVRTLPPPPVPTQPQEEPEPTATISGPIIIPTQNEPLRADLRIEISDNSRTYTPGTTINYTILVTNLGPNDAPRFNVTDSIPAVISGLSVNCTPAGNCGTNTSSGNTVSYTGANLPYQGVITISINGTVASSATGDLVNTATVVIPVGVRVKDPYLANNTVTDRDTQLSVHDLAITKSDGAASYSMATNPLAYTIVVTNAGPSDALNLTVRDSIPPQFASWTWTCAMTNATGCTGVVNSTGNFIDNVVNIRSGGRIEYSVTAIRAGLPPNQNPTTISNTASVTFPNDPRFTDPNPTNNTATDVDVPDVDLQITKDDGGATFLPGGTISYIVMVTNTSTFALTGITVSDAKPPQVTTWGWCIAPCTPNPNSSNSDFTDNFVLAAGSSRVYNVTANISGTVATGEITNTATVNVPNGLVDVSPANNSATAITPINIDLTISKTDGLDYYTPGGTVNYTILVTNNSAIVLNGVTVVDNIPTLIEPASWTWNCTNAPGSPGATCATPSGTGNINLLVNLPAGQSVSLQASGAVISTATGDLVNTATVSPPAGIPDANPANNSAQDVDSPQSAPPLTYVNNDPPDGNVSGSPATGETRTYNLTTPITINGNTSDYEIVFFEWENNAGFIDMDQVIISIGNGANWYRVYYWGDNAVDTNASPPGQTSEPDNFQIPTSLLYGSPFQTGILIDADGGLGNPPNGTYPFLSVTCPLGDADGGCDIDAIGIWP